jgi:hypothetical protein
MDTIKPSEPKISTEEKIATLKRWLGEEIDVVTELEIGVQLSTGLKLRKDPEYKDRWLTTWGTKTDLGLYRTIAEIIIRTLEKNEKENPKS